MLQYHRDRRKVLNIHSDGMGRVEGRLHMTKTQRWCERERGNRTDCRGIPSSFNANIFGLPVQIYNVQNNQKNTSFFSVAQKIDQNKEKLTENGLKGIT